MALLPVSEALQTMLQQIDTSLATEAAALTAACGRVLSAEICSSLNVPPADNSAMDGYALRAADWSPDRVFPVSQRIPAGHHPQPLEPGTCARIFTGAPIPAGADTVVMQENSLEQQDGRVFSGEIRVGNNIRRAGEDIEQGHRLLPAGQRLRPAEIGLLASVGIDCPEVYRRLKVAVVSTGDELVVPGEPLAPGQIYNSNRYLLISWLAALGVDVIDGGNIGDSLDSTVSRLGELAVKADMVLATGGVSVGEEDHVKAAVEQLGSLSVWKLAVKPGKPLAFGKIGPAVFFGLPGNPVSAFVTFRLFVLPCLRRCQGEVIDAATQLEADLIARAAFDWPKPGSREEYLRARLTIADGENRVSLYPKQGSGVLSSVVWADVLVRIPAGITVKQGDPVEVLRLYGPGQVL